jgi:hypothetical protein
MRTEWPKMALCSAVIALCFVGVPDLAMQHFGGESPFWFVFGIWMMPGAFLGMLVAGGHIHDIDLHVVQAINFAFYFGIAFLLLTARLGRKKKGAATS